MVRVDDEYSTDLQKCLDEVKTRMKNAKNPTVILLGGLSGRLDQTTHVLSFLQKLRRRSGPPSRLDKQAETLPWKQSDFKVFMGDQVVSSSLYQAHEQSVDQHKVEDLPDIRVVSENCVAWVLDSVSQVVNDPMSCYSPSGLFLFRCIRANIKFRLITTFMVRPAAFCL